MGSKRQIEANRRNAAKSTGPRSAAGKKRSGRNAIRHGLTLSFRPSAATAKQVEKLARKIVGRSKNEAVLNLARDAAEAVLELERIRKIKVAVIERVVALGEMTPPPSFRSTQKNIRQLNSVLVGKALWTEPTNSLPSDEPLRSIEALRRALPDLLKLDRYEGRAVGRRDRAIKKITSGKFY